MAKRQAVVYECDNCGNQSSQWSGKCYKCGEWNSIQEQLSPSSLGKPNAKSARPLKTITLESAIAKDKERLPSMVPGLDSVLGGGITIGSVNLIAGQPGIGKSTLLLQVAGSIAKTHKVLYVSAEESAHQVSLRAKRIGVKSSGLQLVSTTNTDDIASTIQKNSFDLVIVDSIQTVACNEISSSPGSVSQITNSTRLLAAAAKNSDVPVIIVGHVTKEGAIAGPKILEHVVDVVLQLEGDRYGGFKVLRASKNRYGSTTEAAIYEMSHRGLQAVQNPSASLLEERQGTDGSVVLATLEGTRPLLVEVQALVNRTNYGYPKRTASGIDLNRINLLVAVLEKRTKLNLADQDIYINIVGGIKLTEPASDLAVVMAIASAAKGMKLNKDAVVFGELGLSGELRHVPLIEKRVNEAKKLGFQHIIGPPIKKGKLPAGYSEITSARQALNKFLKK